jgi:peptidoglycan/xylan/chitin deacetylase (PgdA/CDA1 family)
MRRKLSALAAAAALVAATAVALVGPTAGPAAAASCPNGYVGLTYDDGPNPSSTNALLNALKSAGVKATFFVQGNHAQQYPDLLRAEANAGMWIANHSWSHPHLTQGSQANMQTELSNTQNIIKSTTGQTPKLFRPPYGETNSTLKSVESSLGLTEIIWSHDSQDWNGASADSIVNTAARMSNGSIILMHDGGYQSTINAVPRIVQGLASRGLCPGMIQPGTGRVVAPDGGTTTTTTTTTTRSTTTTTTRSTSTTRPSSTTSTTTGGGTGGSCTATAATQSWNGGFVQNVTVKSAGTTSGWTVTIGVPGGAAITSGWSATFSGSSGTVTATNANYNGNAAGGGTTFGFQGTGSPSGMTFACSAS